MSRRAQMQFLFHGAVILLGGMLSGFPLIGAIVHERGPQAVHAWSVTHSSLVSTGILLFVIGAGARHLVLAEWAAHLLSRLLLASAYALCIGLVVAALTGDRGMTPDGSALNLALYAANVAGVLGALCAGGLLVRGAYAGLRGAARAAVEDDAVVGAARREA